MIEPVEGWRFVCQRCGHRSTVRDTYREAEQDRARHSYIVETNIPSVPTVEYHYA